MLTRVCHCYCCYCRGQDVISNEELASLTLRLARSGCDDPEDLCNILVDTCLAGGSRDNMSIIIIRLRGAPKPSPEDKTRFKAKIVDAERRRREQAEAGDVGPAASTYASTLAGEAAADVSAASARASAAADDAAMDVDMTADRLSHDAHATSRPLASTSSHSATVIDAGDDEADDDSDPVEVGGGMTGAGQHGGTGDTDGDSAMGSRGDGGIGGSS